MPKSIDHEVDPALGTWARDRLQPTLLDRLTDDAPQSRKDRPSDLIMSRKQLRRIVTRDLDWLLNSTQLESDGSFDAYPEARRSTINYGLPAFSGKRASDVKYEEFRQALAEAILRFEPRIVPETLRIGGITSENEGSAAHNLLVFQIHGQISATPYPIEVLLKSSIDLETGSVTLQDHFG